MHVKGNSDDYLVYYILQHVHDNSDLTGLMFEGSAHTCFSEEMFREKCSADLLFKHLQSTSEKHKINVPETMNEFLDMSDDEGT